MEEADKKISLSRIESFSFDLDAKKFAEGVFSWSGNYVVRLRVDPQNKRLYINLYYAGKDYRIERRSKKKNAVSQAVAEVEKVLLG